MILIFSYNIENKESQDMLSGSRYPGFRKALFRGLEGESSTLGAKGRVRWKGGGRGAVGDSRFTGGWRGVFGPVGSFRVSWIVLFTT